MSEEHPNLINCLKLYSYGGEIKYEKVQLPQLQEDEVLIKVHASPINPSDNITIQGRYFKKDLPFVLGKQGTGVVVKGRGQSVQKYLNKRVVFRSNFGTWADYSISKLGNFIQIDQDVSEQSASSGIINPLTVLGFISEYRRNKFTGIIHTAAASALGRMLNKLCNSLQIPLLNIVRRKQQAQLLQSEGAKNVLVTQGNWVQKLKQHITNLNLDVVFDAIGGGQVSTKIFTSLRPNGTFYVYGVLSNQSFVISEPSMFFAGITLKGFLLNLWLQTISKEERQDIENNHSKYLKNELKSVAYKSFSFENFKEAIELSNTHATLGKIYFKPQ